MMNRSRGSGSTHRGLGEWLVQRLTAVYLAGFVLWLTTRLWMAPPSGHVAWKAWMGGGVVRAAFALFFLGLLLHAWVGLRSVFLDYLKPPGLRFVVQAITAIALLLCAFWATQILLLAGAP